MRILKFILFSVLYVASHIACIATFGADPLPIQFPHSNNTVIVAYGRLMEAGIYRHPTDTRPDKFLTGCAQYAVSEVVRGPLSDKIVRLNFNAGTQSNPLPTQAILLLTDHSLPNRYSPLGEEADRGILPDIPHNRIRIGLLDNEELAQSPPESHLPRSEAIRLAHQALINYSDYTEYSGASRLIQMHRKPFGWFLSMAVLDKRSPHSGVVPLAVLVSDSGQVIGLSKLLFAPPWSPDEWESIPGVVLE